MTGTAWRRRRSPAGGGGCLLGAGALILLLAGCVSVDELPFGAPDDPEAGSAAAAQPAASRAARMAPSLAGTGFGREVAEAVRSHPSLGAGAARIVAAEAVVASERSRLRPRVVFGADAGVQVVGAGGTQATPLLQVQQLIYEGGAARARSAAARARLEGRRSDRIATAAQLALVAVEASFVLAHERRLLALAERNLDIHRTFLAQIEERVEAGAGTEADLLTARSRLADATTRSVSARGRLERAEASYREVFGSLPARPEPTRPAPALPAGDESALIAGSPRMQSIEAELAAARATVAAAEAARLPSVTLALTGRRGPGGDADVTADLGLRYDVATGGERDAAIRSAEARVAELEAERQDLGREIARSLEFVRSDARTGRARLAAAAAALEANEAAVEAAREQFAVGRRSITQLLDAQRDFLVAAESLAQAELDLALSGFAALALTGDILDVFGIELEQVGALQERG